MDGPACGVGHRFQVYTFARFIRDRCFGLGLGLGASGFRLLGLPGFCGCPGLGFLLLFRSSFVMVVLNVHTLQSVNLPTLSHHR